MITEKFSLNVNHLFKKIFMITFRYTFEFSNFYYSIFLFLHRMALIEVIGSSLIAGALPLALFILICWHDAIRIILFVLRYASRPFLQ